MKKRIIIAGGGTGGHFYPGFSLAKNLLKNDFQILFAVKKNDISIPVLKEAEIPYVELDITALPRSFNPANHISFWFKLFKSIFYSFRILSDFTPQDVLGTGSYVAFPLIFAAKLKKIKTLIHESNSVYGISNRLSGFFADKILNGFPVKNNPFKAKTELTGTPLRDIFSTKLAPETARKELGIDPAEKVLLCFGGSQGSRNLNEALYKYLLEKSRKMNFTLIQVTGRKNYAGIKEKYEKAELLKSRVLLFEYFEDMNLLYSAADLVLCRAGSGTLTELINLKKPAILIPLAAAAGDHQTLNALMLSTRGCALLIKDDEKLFENLGKNLTTLLASPNLQVMKKAYDRLEIPKGDEVFEKIAILL